MLSKKRGRAHFVMLGSPGTDLMEEDISCWNSRGGFTNSKEFKGERRGNQQHAMAKNNESHSQTSNINYLPFSQKAAVQKLMLTIIHFPLKPFCTGSNTLKIYIHICFQQLTLPLPELLPALLVKISLSKFFKQPSQCDAQSMLIN